MKYLYLAGVRYQDESCYDLDTVAPDCDFTGNEGPASEASRNSIYGNGFAPECSDGRRGDYREVIRCAQLVNKSFGQAGSYIITDITLPFWVWAMYCTAARR